MDKKTILIIDDEPDILRLTSLRLKVTAHRSATGRFVISPNVNIGNLRFSREFI